MTLQTITIEAFPRKMRLSEKRRATYFELGKGKAKKLAKKYQDPLKYEWKPYKGKTFLFHKGSNNRVVSNPIAQGTPRDTVISGQMIYNQNMHQFTRNKIVEMLHKFFLDEFERVGLKPFTEEDYPLMITGELFAPYYEYNKNDWDVDNFQFPYVKTFHDSLKIGGYILDDHRGFISKPLSFKYTPSKEYKMKITFEKDRRKVWKKYKQ